MDHYADFYFYGRLVQLVRGKTEGPVSYCFNDTPAIKDAIEALGVPHTEVDLIVVQERCANFAYRLQPGDRIKVFPVNWPVESIAAHHLSPIPPQPIAFILDVHLGKLTRWLRLLGFDCRYRNDFSDEQIARLALAEHRIILTRDRGLLKRGCVSHGYLIGSGQLREQLKEVITRYHLQDNLHPLSRCPQCNTLLHDVDKEQIRHRLQPRTERYYKRFRLCPTCDTLYWQGSHYEKIVQRIEELVTQEALS